MSLVMPVLMVMLLAVADLGRLYVAMTTIESAAREAADYGSFNSSNWIGSADDETSNHAKTLRGMRQRACVTSRHLTDFEGTSTSCTNPALTVSLTESDGTPATACDDPDRVPGPCLVRADVDYTFDLIVPFGIEMLGNRLGLPESLSFTRTRVFANSDFDID